MSKKRLMTMMIVMLLLLTAGGGAVFIIITDQQDSAAAEEEAGVEEELELQVRSEEITTNLKSGNIIRTRFVIQLNSADAVDEFEQRDYQTGNTILQVLADLDARDLDGSDTIRSLEEKLKDEFNSFIASGEVTRVYTQEWIIQ
ncbi:flagellar basal body-associated protein FliL [Alteribacter lacisalsi]|uniref:Flagellar protein FliL n=1 Tax=Alteribacter lacisalsi TaxID=2045244 RepID=A0A2W0HKJ2_9BACI|nr:flagellar basal body-associated FliL family protein [Alteribacter lacisalsi]PYZ98025.1 flagellar basal body-associated protein FliL [Alteribacter lacisalsi]